MAIDPLTPPPPRGLEIEQGGGNPTNIQWYGWFGRLQKRINELVAGSVTQLVAGTNITLSPPGGTGVVTVNASGGGGTGTVTSVSAGSSDIVIGGTPTIAPTVDLSGTVKSDLALAATAVQSVSIATGAGLTGGPLTASGTTVALNASSIANLALAATALQSVPSTVDHTLLADFYGAPDDVWPVMAVPGAPGLNGTNGVNGVNAQALSELLWLESTSEDAWPVMGLAGVNGTNGTNGTNASALSELLWLEATSEDIWPVMAAPGIAGTNGTNGTNGINGANALSELLWLEIVPEDQWPPMMPTQPLTAVDLVRRATVIETRTSTIVLSNSTQLAFALGPGTYAFEACIYVYSSTAVTDGLTANFNYSGSFTAVGSYYGGYANYSTARFIPETAISSTVTAANANLTSVLLSTSSAAPSGLHLQGNLIATGPGTLAFAFAESVSGVDTANLGVGSWMILTQLS